MREGVAGMITMRPEQIRAIRAALGENTAAFGLRFAVSGRTVEDWEQGRHAPRGLALKALERLAKRGHPLLPVSLPPTP
jgi:DNA-binding transcriptional regulator YiaG